MPQLDIATFIAAALLARGLFRRPLHPDGEARACRGCGRRSRGGASGSTATSPAPAQLKADAENVLAEYQKTLASARADAQATLRATGEKLAADAAKRQRALAAALAEQIAAAERRIAAMKDEALAEMRGIAIEVGGAVVEKLTGAPADPARLAAAVEIAAGGRA